MTAPGTTPPPGVPAPNELLALQGKLGSDAYERAWAALMQQHDRMIRQVVRSRRRRARGANVAAYVDDRASETWLNALVGIGSYKGQGPIGGWLRTIAERVVADDWERYVRRLGSPAHSIITEHTGHGGVHADPKALSVDTLLTLVDLARVEAALHPDDLAFWRLRVERDLSLSQIATELQITERASQMRWIRLLARVKRRLDL